MTSMTAWHRVGDRGVLEQNDGRLHVQIEGRYVSIIEHQGELFCLDSICL